MCDDALVWKAARVREDLTRTKCGAQHAAAIISSFTPFDSGIASSPRKSHRARRSEQRRQPHPPTPNAWRRCVTFPCDGTRSQRCARPWTSANESLHVARPRPQYVFRNLPKFSQARRKFQRRTQCSEADARKYIDVPAIDLVRCAHSQCDSRSAAAWIAASPALRVVSHVAWCCWYGGILPSPRTLCVTFPTQQPQPHPRALPHPHPRPH